MNSYKTDIEALFREQYQTLCMYALHYVDDIDVAEDIVMDCFVKITERIMDGENMLSPDRYVSRMVRNACLDHIKKNVPQTNTEEMPDMADDDMESHREQYEREVKMWTEIDKLPKACRDVFLMSKRDGMKYADIAEELGISVKTVEAHVSKAYKKLRKEVITLYFLLF